MDIAARNTTDRSPTPRHPQHAETMETIPARHPLRWVSAAVVVVIAVSVVVSLATNDNLKWSVVGDYLFSRLVFEGLWTTLWLTVAAMILGIAGGVMLAVMRLSANPILSGLAGGVRLGVPRHPAAGADHLLGLSGRAVTRSLSSASRSPTSSSSPTSRPARS